jgi:hypothetical protein
MFIGILLFIRCVFLFPRVSYWLGIDFIHYIKEKWWLIFEGWGLHIYVGRFGAGKTSSMVYDAYCLAKKYKQLTILTNFHLDHFPEHTQILPLRSPQDILNAPDNTLVLIDEIGTIFNSRDFASSKESVPKILFQHLCQCRKRHLMMYATSQRWNFVDKQLRDIVATVRVCRVHLQHPFSRLGTVHVYDAHEYDLAFSNPMVPLTALNAYAYVQSDFVRNLYDTSELVQNMLKAEYVSDAEILQNRGEIDSNITELSKDGKRSYRKTSRKV